MKEKLKVPKLRFKEFSGEWEERRLDLFLIEYKERVSADTEIPVLTSSRKGLFFQEDYFDNRRLDNEGEYGVVPYGYFTYRHMSDDSTFKFNINKIVDRGAVSKEYPIFTTSDELNSEFLQLSLNYGNSFQKFAIEQKKGGTRTRLYFKVLKELFLPLPTLPEQQKIADFLSKVDEKIEKLTKKKELLEQYKKGLMQKIFSQELRFKDDNGNDFPEWEEKELGEVLIKNSIKNKNQEFQLVQSVSNKYGFVNQDEYFEDRTVASKDLSNYYVIKKGMFAYNPSRIDVGSLAYKYDNEISVISPLYISFEANNSFIADNYLLNWFGTIQFKNQMNRSFEGSVRNTLSYEALRKILIEFPSLPEQQKIADFLSALDKKIDIVDKELGQVQEFKKGLLQQMFV